MGLYHRISEYLLLEYIIFLDFLFYFSVKNSTRAYILILYKQKYKNENHPSNTISLLSEQELVNYVRKNGNNTFSRNRKIPLKDMLLCCLSKKGLTTTLELRNYFKDKGELSMQLSV